MSVAGFGPLAFFLAALVAVVGALAIHWLRGGPASRGAPAPSLDSARIGAEEDPALAALLKEIAARMGLPERVLPRAHGPTGDGDFVWRQGENLHYASLERGARTLDLAGSNDEILYRVFCDRTRMHAYIATIGMEEPAREAEIRSRQRAMLESADPAWAARFDALG